MKIFGPPIFKTAIRPFEVALLICYLQEVSRREKSQYLSRFLGYISTLVLAARMPENMSLIQIAHAFEQAEAVLADIRQNGEPYDLIPPRIEFDY
jgi:hypothetical protein